MSKFLDKYRRPSIAGAVLVSLVTLILVADTLGVFGPEDGDDFIHIAVIGPMSGDGAESGKNFVRGAQLYLDEINRTDLFDGKILTLDVHDDKNQPDSAASEARNIAANDRAVAVIGHEYSSCSLSAGPVYREARIPAVTPVSTNDTVTEGNPWYFRTIYTNTVQARLLAAYIKNILDKSSAAIIHNNRAYGRYSAKVFSEAAAELDMPIENVWEINPAADDFDASLDRLVRELAHSRAEIVFLPLNPPEGAPLVKRIKDAGIEIPLIAPHSLAAGAFIKKLGKDATHYSDGMYVSTPLVFDTANEQAQHFRHRFIAVYGEEPNWDTAYAYESAHLIVEALQAVYAEQPKGTLAQWRQGIRDYLAGIDSPRKAIRGITGLTYFDAERNAQRPIVLGTYRSRHIISAFTQLQKIHDPEEISDLEQARAQGGIVLADGEYMYKTTVAYTGIKFYRLGELDLENLSYEAEFLIWFRYKGEIDPAKVEFANTLDAVELDLILEKQEGPIKYRLYRGKGRFHSTVQNHFALQEKLINVQFLHYDLPRNNLIYVVDFLGMDLAGEDYAGEAAEQARYAKILNAASGWQVREIHFFQDSLRTPILGDPDYLDRGGVGMVFSRMNAELLLQRIRFSLRGLISYRQALYLGAGALAAIFGLLVLRRCCFRLRRFAPIWLSTLALTSLLLLSGEVIALQHLAQVLHHQNLEFFIVGFDTLWWVMGAYFAVRGLEGFFWRPLEQATGHTVPSLLRHFVQLIVYLIAFFGIVAFVFDQKLTSLLATSGVLAMIIGLAVQINISNIFSGIALNLERPFKIGDWVKIGDYDEGQIIDTNWRATRIRTRRLNILNIPNSNVADSNILNYSGHAPSHYRVRLDVHVHPRHAPEQVRKVLIDAVLGANDMVHKEPPPLVFFEGAKDWWANYAVLFVITDYQRRYAIESQVWILLWEHLHNAGIELETGRCEFGGPPAVSFLCSTDPRG